MINYTKVTCALCSKEFNLRTATVVYETKKNSQKLFYCSKDCTYEAKRKNISSVCEFCQTPFKRKSNGRRETGKFCSRACAARSAAKDKISGMCKLCDKTIIASKTYCDDCRGNYGANRTLGELREKYSISQYHAKIRMGSRKSYGLSNRPMKCYICDYDLHVDICHVWPVQYFDSDATLGQVNDPSNLVALCKNHHWEFDHGIISLQDRKVST